MRPAAPALDNTGSYILQEVRGIQISRGLYVFPSPSQPLSAVPLLYTSCLMGCAEQACESKDAGNLERGRGEGGERKALDRTDANAYPLPPPVITRGGDRIPKAHSVPVECVNDPSYSEFCWRNFLVAWHSTNAPVSCWLHRGAGRQGRTAAGGLQKGYAHEPRGPRKTEQNGGSLANATPCKRLTMWHGKSVYYSSSDLLHPQVS